MKVKYPCTLVGATINLEPQDEAILTMEYDLFIRGGLQECGTLRDLFRTGEFAQRYDLETGDEYQLQVRAVKPFDLEVTTRVTLAMRFESTIEVEIRREKL